ncbi:DNA polymerase gamma [Sphaerosporella brunnea]|uniref:DNA-directed DNA polymerase n=1 Tax=Sphaerosporella brunnea TaxID=1250544 RepID=A0A5J5EPK6_9PEZI|nr:DNA polymerase gamma [Sphaerosporella brunnea]
MPRVGAYRRSVLVVARHDGGDSNRRNSAHLIHHRRSLNLTTHETTPPQVARSPNFKTMLSSLRCANRVVQRRYAYGVLLHRIAHASTSPAWQTVPIRRYAEAATSQGFESTVASQSLNGESAAESTALKLKGCPKEEQEFNAIGVQHIPPYVRNQIFRPRSDTGAEAEERRQKLVELAQKHLQKHELLGKTTEGAPPISFELPKLQGKTLDEHFYKLGMEASEPYLGLAKVFAHQDTCLPEKPESFVVDKSGWTKYVEGEDPVSVDAPEENMLVFDVEVLYKESPFAIMACAASPNAWYSWLSPWLLEEREGVEDRHLVPLGDANTARIVVGHNIGYDRARILEEYSIKPTKNSFLDTMSLHVAVNGMCSRQRPTWMKHAKAKNLRDKFNENPETSPELSQMLGNNGEEEEELWVGRSSINSLRDVAKFHCEIGLDKEIRDAFGTLNRAGVRDRLSELMLYCAADVDVTHQVYKAVFPRFLEVCPHPVSFGALRHLSSVALPVNQSWQKYIETAEKKYQELSEKVSQSLKALAEEAVQKKDDLQKEDTKVELDEWLQQLDWEIQPVRLTKATKKEDPRPVKNQKMPGFPKWYKDLHPKTNSPMNLTTRSRIAPLLLKMTWNNNPLIWSDLHGWVFRVSPADEENYADSPVVKVSMQEETNYKLRDDTTHIYFKVPHKDGPQARCTAVLAKSYQQYFEAEILGSENPLAQEALEMNAMCSYWISARERIRGQMVVYEDDPRVELGLESRQDTLGATGSEAAPHDAPEGAPTNLGSEANPGERLRLGMILPQIIPMGTITRRAVENTWLTASNAKKNRVGSELKAMVKAPPGYVFVGADVDSEELWIASLVGDSQFKLHGGGALGFMTLEGAKSAGTDLHSKTASILGISRNHAKVFNYGRIYGAGLMFASTLLRQFNPSISDSQATKVAEKLYQETKGVKTTKRKVFPRPFWRGGTESLVFNKLEDFAEQDLPRTPVLGAGITEALMRKYINKGGYLTSRINWAIQSSGVDYLHLLIISMDYLIRLYGLNARLAITVHDEIRYLVKEEDKYRVALALQIANVWTRAMFSQQMGIEDLPQSCAWFSAVDIDTVLRKEVDLDCVTPSHPNPIPPGESVDIQTLLEKGDAAVLDTSKGVSVKLDDFEYTPRVPVMETMNAQVGSAAENEKMALLRLQAQLAEDSELKDIEDKIDALKEADNIRSEKNYEDLMWGYSPDVCLPPSGQIPKVRRGLFSIFSLNLHLFFS